MVGVNELNPIYLTPQATPYDTFVRGEEKGPNLLSTLASGLSSVHPALMEYGMKKMDEQQKADNASAAEAYREALLKDRDLNKRQWKDLVEGGVVPAGASPWFKEGWRQQQLRQMGEDFGKDIATSWSQSGVRNSDDQSKFNQFVAGKQQEWMDKVKSSDLGFTPQELNEFYHPVVDHYTKTIASNQLSHRMEETERQVIDTTSSEISGIAQRKDLSVSERASHISALINDVTSKGLYNSVAGKTTVDAIVETAVATKDREILDILPRINSDTVKTSGNYALSKITEARSSIMRMEEHERAVQWSVEDRAYQMNVVRPRAEEAHKHQREAWARADAVFNREEHERALSSVGATAILSNPTGDFMNSDWFKKLAATDYQRAQSIMSFQHATLQSREGSAKLDDPLTVGSIMLDISTSPKTFDMERLTRAVTNGYMSVDRMSMLMNMVSKANNGSPDPLLHSKEFEEYIKAAGAGALSSVDEFGVEGMNSHKAKAEMSLWGLAYVSQARERGEELTLEKFSEAAAKKSMEIAAKYNSLISDSVDSQQQQQQQQGTVQNQQQIKLNSISLHNGSVVDANDIQQLINNPAGYAATFRSKYGENSIEEVRSAILQQSQQQQQQQKR